MELGRRLKERPGGAEVSGEQVGVLNKEKDRSLEELRCEEVKETLRKR